MFSAICADCRKPCQVPFRPSGDKPIYCRECFMKRKEKTVGDSWRPSAPQGGGAKQNPVLSKPQQSSGGVQLVDLKRQRDLMVEKLDMLIQKLEGTGTKAEKSAVKKVVAKKVKKAGKGKK